MTQLSAQFLVNSARATGAAPGVTVRGVTIVTVPKTVAQGGVANLPNFSLEQIWRGDASVTTLTLNDAASLAAAGAGNVLWTAPLSALVAGTYVPLNATLSNGLVVSQLPPGVSLGLDYL